MKFLLMIVFVIYLAVEGYAASMPSEKRVKVWPTGTNPPEEEHLPWSHEETSHKRVDELVEKLEKEILQNLEQKKQKPGASQIKPKHGGVPMQVKAE